MKKRANGEGSVIKLGDGRWQARCFVNTVDGRKRKSFYGKTKAEALRKMRVVQNSSDNGLVINTENPTIKAFLSTWLAGKKGTVKPTTFDSYSYLAKNHIMPVLGNKKIRSLQPVHVQELYSSKRVSGVSGRLIQLIHITLHSALEQAVAWKMVPENVTKFVNSPRATKHEIKALTAEQARVLIRTSSGSRFEALFVLAIHCGLRKGELLGLRWSDVDFESGELTVRQQLVRSTEGLAFSTPKNGKGRNVLMSTIAKNTLTSHRVKLAQEKLLARDSWSHPNLVFPSVTGTPMSPENLISRIFKPLLKKAGLPNIRFHDLRHTCATLLLSKGEHPKIVQERLGHASIAITLDTYSHVLPSMQKGASALMDEIFADTDAESA